MERREGRALGHYAAIGVAPGASPRAVEAAFERWRRRRVAGGLDAESWRRAEEAYHVLLDPAARARHDRQLGLARHPAWRAESEREGRVRVARAVTLLGRDRPRSARTLLERAVGLIPGDPAAHSYLAVALARSGGSRHDAVRHARLAVERRPRDPDFLFNLAEVYAAAGLRRLALASRGAAWFAAVLAALARRPQAK